MKNLSAHDVNQVSGGIMCYQGICLTVDHTGIPDQYYNVIERNFEQGWNARVTAQQMMVNIALESPGAMDYVEIFTKRFMKQSVDLLLS